MDPPPSPLTGIEEDVTDDESLLMTTSSVSDYSHDI
jgi:hypothetical protein